MAVTFCIPFLILLYCIICVHRIDFIVQNKYRYIDADMKQIGG